MMILHNVFLQGIRVCILLNTLSLSLEHHDQPENLTKVRTSTSMINRTNSYDIFIKALEVSNLVFSCIFSIEMMLKLLAFGAFEYFDDGFNVFDSLIVCLG